MMLSVARRVTYVIMGMIWEINLSRGGPTISYILFIYDSLFFLKYTVQNCGNLAQILHEYCVDSG